MSAHDSSAYSSSSTLKKERFMGKLQPVKSRVPNAPDVDFARGGSDFRMPHNLSSFGKQIVKENCQKVLFGTSKRFRVAGAIGVGPNYAGVSSMARQIISHRRSPASLVFGTSTRDGERKLYS